MSTPKLTNEIVAAAIAGFEGQKRQIDTQIAELRAWLSGLRPSRQPPWGSRSNDVAGK
jgi:hypothetical protein